MQDEDYPQKVPFTVMINPIITPTESSRETVYFEGCLSIPLIYGLVPRHSSINVTHYDVNGEKCTFTATGWFARVIQHESVLSPSKSISMK